MNWISKRYAAPMPLLIIIINTTYRDDPLHFTALVAKPEVSLNKLIV